MDKIFISLIKVYKKFSNIIWTYKPAIFIYSNCKFYPTCSEYTHLAVQKYGALPGLTKGLKRICRCNFYSKGGYDPVN